MPLSIVPLSVIRWEDAIKKIWEGTVSVLETYDRTVRSPSVSYDVPAVIMLKDYKKTARNVKFSRSNVFLRDEYICQYCDLDMKNDSELWTLDHVIPRNSGGKTKWDNVVTACPPCNHKKGHETKGWSPKNLPIKPSIWDLISKRKKMPIIVPHESWIQYLGWDKDLVILR